MPLACRVCASRLAAAGSPPPPQAFLRLAEAPYEWQPHLPFPLLSISIPSLSASGSLGDGSGYANELVRGGIPGMTNASDGSMPWRFR